MNFRKQLFLITNNRRWCGGGGDVRQKCMDIRVVQKTKLSQIVGPDRKTIHCQTLIKKVYGTDLIRVELEALKSDKAKNLAKFKCSYLDEEVMKFIGCCCIFQVLKDTLNPPKETRLDTTFVHTFHLIEVHDVFAKKLCYFNQVERLNESSIQSSLFR